jgi:hypothetical protein
MSSLRVWVSYAADNSQQEAALVQQLIGDLRKAGAIVVTDGTVSPGEQFQSVLQRELSRCQWFLLVQTQQAVRSNRVLSAMNVAMVQAKQGMLRGVMRIVCPSSDAWEEPVRWSETMSYSYNGDYPRLRDKILLDLGLLGLDDDVAARSVVEKDVSSVATRWLVLDQEARVAQEYPTSNPGFQGYPAESPARGYAAQSLASWGYPAESSAFQGYPAGNGDRPASWRRKEKMRERLASLNPAPLFARLQQARPQRKMPAAAGVKMVPGDRPPPRPFLFSPRFWLYGVALLSVLLLLSVPVLAFAGVLPLPIHLSHASGKGVSGGKATPSPTSMASTGRQGVVPPPPTAPPVLAQDPFQRADQALWGTASDGKAWGGDANISPAFSIVNGTGQIANATGMLEALTDPIASNADVEVTVTANQFADNVNMMNIGVTLRWQDTNDWYKALIDGNNFSIDKAVNGNMTIIDTMPFAAQGGTAYTIRFEAIGTTLQAKVWPSNQAEPPNWMLVISDATFAQGQAGVRVIMQNTTRINVLSFKETAL